MKNIISKVLLCGGLFLLFNTNTYSRKIFSDVFIYKISNNVYSLNDLRQTQENLVALSCYYPQSLVTRVFRDLITKGKNKSIFEVKDYTKTPYSKEQKSYFKSIIAYHKLKFYSDAHKTAIQKQIAKAFYMASRQLKCPIDIFSEDKNFLPGFEEVMRIELFLRSRYLPEEKDSKKVEADFKQAISGIKNLMDSIDKQVTEEVFW